MTQATWFQKKRKIEKQQVEMIENRVEAWHQSNLEGGFSSSFEGTVEKKCRNHSWTHFLIMLYNK